MKILGLGGWSGAGKTTLLGKLIPELIRRGITVSTMKHAHHGFDVDQPGKDSLRPPPGRRHRSADRLGEALGPDARAARSARADGVGARQAHEPGRPAAGRRLQARAARQAGNLPRGKRQAAALDRRSDLCRDPDRHAGRRHQAAGDRPQRRAGDRRLHRAALRAQDEATTSRARASVTLRCCASAARSMRVTISAAAANERSTRLAT